MERCKSHDGTPAARWIPGEKIGTLEQHPMSCFDRSEGSNEGLVGDDGIEPPTSSV